MNKSSKLFFDALTNSLSSVSGLWKKLWLSSCSSSLLELTADPASPSHPKLLLFCVQCPCGCLASHLVKAINVNQRYSWYSYNLSYMCYPYLSSVNTKLYLICIYNKTCIIKNSFFFWFFIDIYCFFRRVDYNFMNFIYYYVH